MKLNDMSEKIESRIDNATTIEDLKQVIRFMVDENTLLTRRLENLLSNLDSENVKEINFQYTRYPKAKQTILKGYATEEWANARFALK